MPASTFSGGAVGERISSPAASLTGSGTTITITATTNFDLSDGRFGAAVAINGGASTWYDGAGAVAGAQSVVLALADIGAVASDLIGIDPGYSLTDPAVDKVYASDSGLYITPSIATPTISDTTPTDGDALVGTNGTALTRLTATRSVLWLADNVSTGDSDTSYSVVTGDVGKVLTFQNTTSDGGSATSAETAAVASAGPPATDRYAWYKLNTGITEAGTGVSEWADNDGSGRDLVQSDDAKRPTKEVDGSITFNGTSDGLAASFTLNQPYVVYIKYKSLGWTSTDRIYDGPTRASMQQNGVDPDIQMNAGGGNVGTKEVAADGNYHIVRAAWNGASSILEVDATSPETVNPGTQNPGGFSVGANGAVTGQYSNIQVKEIIIYNNTQSAGDTTATLDYLSTV